MEFLLYLLLHNNVHEQGTHKVTFYFDLSENSEIQIYSSLINQEPYSQSILTISELILTYFEAWF